MLMLLGLFAYLATFIAKNSNEPLIEFTDIRQGVSLCSWLYYTPNKEGFQNRPLLLFLSGGPGQSSIAIGNYLQIGPVDSNGNKRSTSWLSEVNLLFVDSPIGTGFSYAEEKYYATTWEAVVDDLTVFMTRFYEKHPQLHKVPLYVFGESYSGKIAPRLALKLHQMSLVNVAGMGIGGPMISPLDTSQSYGDYYLKKGIINAEEAAYGDQFAETYRNALKEKNYTAAEQSVFRLVDIIGYVNKTLNLYNVGQTKQEAAGVLRYASEGETSPGLRQGIEKVRALFPNAVIRKKLSLTISLATLFSRDVASDALAYITVQKILRDTNMKVLVYNGEMDGMVTPRGSERFINKLNWSGESGYKAAKMQKFVGGTFKEYGRLSYFNFANDGHYCLAENSKAGFAMFTHYLYRRGK